MARQAYSSWVLSATRRFSRGQINQACLSASACLCRGRYSSLQGHHRWSRRSSSRNQRPAVVGLEQVFQRWASMRRHRMAARARSRPPRALWAATARCASKPSHPVRAVDRCPSCEPRHLHRRHQRSSRIRQPRRPARRRARPADSHRAARTSVLPSTYSPASSDHRTSKAYSPDRRRSRMRSRSKTHTRLPP